MNFRSPMVSAISLVVMIVVSVVTYQAMAVLRPPVTPMDNNPTITLVLPDQEYAIAKRDLESSGAEIVIPSLENMAPKIIYDSVLGVVQSTMAPKDYVVNVNQLKTAIATQRSDAPIMIVPDYAVRDRYAERLTDYNLRLNRTYRSPLQISVKDGAEFTRVELAPAFIRTIIHPQTIDLEAKLDVDQHVLITYLTDQLTAKQKQYFNPTVAYQNTKNALNSRFRGNTTPPVLGVDDGPTSRGEKADRYLEVDLSQQKMYFFITGSLYKEYHVSTGIDYPTPVGEYHILNKAPKAFSEIYGVWMPYWMGFTYANEVGAYLGIHEIAYAVDARGKPFYRHGYYIGDKMTGGCVAMEPKNSREIYNLSTVGMLVRIVP